MRKAPAYRRCRYLEIDGVEYKECYGLTHEVRPAMVPVEQFYKRGGGSPFPDRLRGQCIKCHNVAKALVRNYDSKVNTHIRVIEVISLVRELKKRVGYKKTAKAMGVSHHQLYMYLNGDTYMMRRERARKLVLALNEIRSEQVGITADEMFKARMTLRIKRGNAARHGTKTS